MAFGRRRRGPRMPRQPKQPKQPRVKKVKVPKIPRPSAKGLRIILKGLLTVSLPNRIATLSYALAWYDQALPYLVQKGQLDVKAKKLLEIAVKCRKLGIGAANDDEKETGFLTALRQYEKACASIKPPLVEKFYDQFKAKKAVLEDKQKRLEAKFGNVIVLLQKAIGNRIKLQVADAQKPFQYDPGLTSVTYNREAAQALANKYRAEGILAVVLDQMPILVQHAALEPGTGEKAGTWVYDPARHIAINDEIMQSFLAFAKTAEAPNKLVRNGVVREPKVKVPRPPGQPGVPRVKASSPRPTIGGMAVPGSRNRAVMCSMVYERIKDGLEHPLTDVLAGVDTPSRINQLQRYGKLWGTFDLSLTKSTVKLMAVKP
jgi:hypothetical protein